MATVSQQQQQKLIAGTREIAELPPTKKIDTRGLVCPFPAFETAKLISSSSESDVLEIISGERYTAETSIPAVLKHKDYESAIIENTSDGTFSIIAAKKTK